MKQREIGTFLESRDKSYPHNELDHLGCTVKIQGLLGAVRGRESFQILYLVLKY